MKYHLIKYRFDPFFLYFLFLRNLKILLKNNLCLFYIENICSFFYIYIYFTKNFQIENKKSILKKIELHKFPL